MHIKRIKLRNFRIYHGENQLVFPKSVDKNISVVSGNNGYGKTTLLTSLVWGLYGRLMVEVDTKFRREIYDTGGYKKYASNNLNRLSKVHYEEFLQNHPEATLSEIKNKNLPLYDQIIDEGKSLRSYSVSILLTDLNIPTLPCDNIEIIRTYDTDKNDDTIQILIDGKENELTKEVGDEIFVNDFILPKEIAKFFFFDAEKIVSLAEIKSVEDKKVLSKAYSEVLGIKKYEDLKINLEDLRIRFRRNSATEKDRKKLTELQKEVEQFKKLIDHNESKLVHWQGEKDINRQLSEQLQEKLIREGNSLSFNELTDLKKLREKLSSDADVIKNKIKEFLDIAPFAIVGDLFMKAKLQNDLEKESKINSISPAILKQKYNRIKNDIISEMQRAKVKSEVAQKIIQTFHDSYSKNVIGKNKNDSFKVLLAFDEKESNEFDAIYNNLKYSFSVAFKQLIKDYKNNRIFFNKVIRKISLAETKENDLLIKEIRLNKNEVDLKLEDIELKLNGIHQEIGGLQKEIAIKSKVISELAKKVNLEDNDKLKDETAGRIIMELDTFINKFKNEKKQSLELKIKKELNVLMHKKDFINRVEVVLFDDMIDIILYDKRNDLINTESLSKGEQQLYATALLKALVDESNIDFPVFIDSPLQKFDKKHSINIIRDFYPNISGQVVLFPLLEKELTETEFQTLLPNVNRAYLINNVNEDSSVFEQIEAKELFNLYKKEIENVYNN